VCKIIGMTAIMLDKNTTAHNWVGVGRHFSPGWVVDLCFVLPFLWLELDLLTGESGKTIPIEFVVLAQLLISLHYINRTSLQ